MFALDSLRCYRRHSWLSSIVSHVTNIAAILDIPPKMVPLYERSGQLLKGLGDGVLLIHADQIVYLGQFVQFCLSDHPTMQGLWLSVPCSFVVLIVSGDRRISIGFGSD